MPAFLNCARTVVDSAARPPYVSHGRPGALRLVDKAPLNFFHLGLVAQLFPRARIVWCRRDARDVGLSIFGENFALGATFSTDLADIGAVVDHHRPLAVVHARTEQQALQAAALLRAAYRVGGKPAVTTDPVLDRITA